MKKGMEIKEYKGYKYILYEDGNIYFNGSLYNNLAYLNLETFIKRSITNIIKEYNDVYNGRFRNYFSQEYLNGLIESKVKNEQ